MNTQCPDEERIADYLEERLDAETVQEIEKHLRACRGCMEIAMISAGVLRGDDSETIPAPGRVVRDAVRLAGACRRSRDDSLKEKTLKWIRDVGSRFSSQRFSNPPGIVCPAPVRSRKEGAALLLKQDRMTIEGMDVRVDVERSSGEKALLKIRLTNVPENLRRMRLTLKKGQREIASQLLAEEVVVFEDIGSGRYVLSFVRDGLEIDSYRFEI